MGSSIRTATRVFGGYGPSATFRIFLKDGRTVFTKGAGLGSNTENWRVVPLEESAYRNIEAIRAVAPAYFGSVAVEGWHLLVLEDLKGTRQVPPWTEALALQAVRDIAAFHLQGMNEQDKVDVMPAASLVDSWTHMQNHVEDRDYFLNLFQSRRKEAEAWLQRVQGPLDEAASQLMNLNQPWGLVHTDIRSDNLRFKGGKMVLFDWPSLTSGPLICDVTFFAPSLTSEGGPPAEHLLAEYRRVMVQAGVTFPVFADGAAAAATAGYFANRAGRPPIPGLPRLRQVQRLQLGPALRWAALSLGLPQPPRPDGERP